MARPDRSKVLLLLFGGILPVLAFAFVEDRYGVIWGTIAGMVFGVGEILYEKLFLKKVSGVTWFSNALILVLGAITWISQDGVWFKLQPAIFFAAFGVMLIGSHFIRQPLLTGLAKKQNPQLPMEAEVFLRALNLRLGFVFLFLAGLSTWAALDWSTKAWAFLKSVGAIIIIFIYMGGEIAYRRFFKDRR